MDIPPTEPDEGKRFTMERIRTLSAALTPVMTLVILILTIINVFFR